MDAPQVDSEADETSSDPTDGPTEGATGDPTDGSVVDPAVEAVRHLHAASQELFAAARSFLDVAEDLAEDPERLRAIGETVTEVFRGVAAGSAGSRGAAASHGTEPPWAAGASAAANEEPDDPERAAHPPDEPAEAPATGGTAPRRSPRPTRSGSARVRRIPLD